MAVNLATPQILSSFQCIYCQKTFVSPIILPCGLTICQAHTSNEMNFACLGCEKPHVKPEQGFPPNKALESLIESANQVNSNDQEHLKGMALCEKLKSEIDKFDLIMRDPHSFIHDHVAAFRNLVDLKRESFKLAIDEYANRVHKSIDEYEQERKKFVDSGEFAAKATTTNDNETLSLEKFKSSHESFVTDLNRLNAVNMNHHAEYVQQKCQQEIDSISKITNEIEKSLKPTTSCTTLDKQIQFLERTCDAFVLKSNALEVLIYVNFNL